MTAGNPLPAGARVFWTWTDDGTNDLLGTHAA